MIRAKFETPEKQREFFINVKNKLGVGARKLSKKLGLKSRGSIESYTFMRTSPPIEIVKKLEKLSGIKAKYDIVEGKIYRKRRKFIPLEPKEAEKILKKKFNKNFVYLIDLIKTDLTIKDIVNRIRKRGYSFDNSQISRCIGAYRTNLLSKIIKDIKPNDKEIIISGHVRKDRKTLSVNFNLAPLYNIIKEKDIKIGLEISKDHKKIRIFPLKFGRKLNKSNKAIKILITEKSGLEIKSNVKIILNPTLFGFSIYESIYDNDAKILAKEALKKGFILDQQRSTPANHKGDLSLYLKDKNIIIEITRASSYKSAYFKVGQIFIQKKLWSKSIQVLICEKSLLLPSAKKALDDLNINIIYTNFEKGWEKEVLERINENRRFK